MVSYAFKTSTGFACVACRWALAILGTSPCNLPGLRRRAVGSFLCGVVIWALIPHSARADSFTWILPSDGFWDNAINWTPYLPLPPNPIVGPPDTGDVAIIQTPYRVTLQDDVLALAGLLIANGASVNMNFNELGVVADDHGGVATITGQGSELIVRHTAGNVNAFYVDRLNLANGGELDIEGTVARIIAGLDVDADSLITGRGELIVQTQINGVLGSGFNNRGRFGPISIRRLQSPRRLAIPRSISTVPAQIAIVIWTFPTRARH